MGNHLELPDLSRVQPIILQFGTIPTRYTQRGRGISVIVSTGEVDCTGPLFSFVIMLDYSLSIQSVQLPAKYMLSSALAR